jgi:LEA14-like dessication related protein
MNRITKISVGGVLMVFAAMVCGCTNMLPPTFTADGVRELETLDGRTRMVFVINATNPNKEPIPLEQVVYEISIDGEGVFSGLRSPETTLPGYSSLLFELPAIVGSDVLASGREVSYGINGSVKYHVPGPLAEVLYDADLKVPEAPLAIEGTINLGGQED